MSSQGSDPLYESATSGSADEVQPLAADAIAEVIGLEVGEPAVAVADATPAA
jgi:hypothetical protein